MFPIFPLSFYYNNLPFTADIIPLFYRYINILKYDLLPLHDEKKRKPVAIRQIIAICFSFVNNL